MCEATIRELCPRCEEGVLAATLTTQDISVSGSTITVPNVQADVCPRCGFRSLSGRSVGLFDLLFAPQYSQVSDLVQALRQAGYRGMFLKESEAESNLGFGSREYVSGLAGELRDLYLDNESSHVLRALSEKKASTVPVCIQEKSLNISLPKLGEGENGVVYNFLEDALSVIKVAKPRSYSRNHLIEEYEATDFFLKNNIPVSRISISDPYGNFMIKEKLAGVSLAKIYYELGQPDALLYRNVKEKTRAFVFDLLELFVKHPETKTSLSPNNIFIEVLGDDCRCLLVDIGPAPLHDYSSFDYEHYWSELIPQKIVQYRAVGYL